MGFHFALNRTGYQRAFFNSPDRYVDALVRAFETLAILPSLAREQPEFVPPVRIHPHGRHLIVYTSGADHIVIVRLLGSRQDWVDILKTTGPDDAFDIDAAR